MGLSKEQVERHIASIQKRLTSTQERAHHGYEFARLCVEVKKYQDAIRYLGDYLSVQEKDFRAHRLMGQACEKEQLIDKALLHYNRSLELKGDQREIAITVAKLYCEVENPPMDMLKMCLERIKNFINVHSLVLALSEKMLRVGGGGGGNGDDDGSAATLAQEQLSMCKDDVEAHIHLVNHYATAGELEKALTHCLSQRQNRKFSKSKVWLECVIQTAEKRYVSIKDTSPQNFVAQCGVLIVLLDHLFLLFQTSNASGSLMAGVLLKYDKVLFVAVQALKAQQANIRPVQRVALREFCGEFYLLLASYIFWCHRYKSTFTGNASIKFAQVGNLCLLASLSFPPPNLDSIPLVRGPEQRQELEAWHSRSNRRLCVVGRQLQLVSKMKGQIYLGKLSRLIEGQGGKLGIIKAVFTENEDLRGVRVMFASSNITYNIRNSYMVAESEHLLAHGQDIQLPPEAKLDVCDRLFFLQNGGHLPSLIWLALCLKAINGTAPVFRWLPDIFRGLRSDLPGSYLDTTSINTLSLPDTEAMLVLAVHTLQLTLTSPPLSNSLPNSLLRHLPATMETELQGSDWSMFCRWWSCVHDLVNNTNSDAEVKRIVSEGLGVVRGNRPLQLNLSQISALARHFQQRAETLVEAASERSDEAWPFSPSLVEDMIWRSCHYWDIVVAVLSNKDRGFKLKFHRTLESTTPSGPGGLSLLNEAHMALANAAAYRKDLNKALGLYSKVTTAMAAWNQAQIYLVLAKGGGSPSGDVGFDGDLMKKAADCLELATSRLKPMETELKEKIEAKQEEVKKLLPSNDRRSDVAVSLTFDSSPESSPLIPRKASTPAASSARVSRLSPFSPEKMTPSQMDSLREELREKDVLILSMNEQLKILSAEVSALKLHHTPPGYGGSTSAYLSHSFQHPSPHAVAGSLPRQFLTPTGTVVYQHQQQQQHPSQVASFRSSLLSSPMTTGGMVQQQQQLQHSVVGRGGSPQTQLAPLPPHLSPSSGLQQSFQGSGVHYAAGSPQQTMVAMGTTTGYRLHQTAAGPQAGLVGGGGGGSAVYNEQPIVGRNQTPMMMSNYQMQSVMQRPQQQQMMQQQLLIQQQQQQQLLIQQQQQLLLQQKQQQQQQQQQHGFPQQPRLPASQQTAASSTSSTSFSQDTSLSAAGFVLKPGIFVSSSSVDQRLTSAAPPSSLSPGQPTVKTTTTSAVGFSPAPPPPSSFPTASQPPSSTFGKMAALNVGSDSKMPFSTSLPQAGGFQFAMRPPPPLTSNVKFGEQSAEGERAKRDETLASLLANSAAVTTVGLAASGGIAMTTTAPLNFYPSSTSTTVPSSLGGGQVSFSISAASTATTKNSVTFAPLPFSSTSEPLSFASLAAAADTTTAGSSLTFGSLGGTSLFGASGVPTLSSGKRDEEEAKKEHELSYDAMPDFEPIVSLPALDEISTGEEDETVLFAHRAKLYRFCTTTSSWKERGIGEIKILAHKISGKTRVLMRRDQILKICCNHYITGEMALTALSGKNQLAWFTHCDFSDGETRPEKLAVKFKLASVAGQFQTAFETCVEKAKGHSKPEEEEEDEEGEEEEEEDEDEEYEDEKEDPGLASSSTTTTTAASLKERFAAPVGSWDCDTCLVQNSASSVKCLACGTAKPGSSGQTDPSSSSLPQSLTGMLASSNNGGLKFGETGFKTTEGGLKFGESGMKFGGSGIKFGEGGGLTSEGGGFQLGGGGLRLGGSSITFGAEGGGKMEQKNNVPPLFGAPSSVAMSTGGAGGGFQIRGGLSLSSLLSGKTPTQVKTEGVGSSGSSSSSGIATSSTDTSSAPAVAVDSSSGFKPGSSLFISSTSTTTSQNTTESGFMFSSTASTNTASSDTTKTFSFAIPKLGTNPESETATSEKSNVSGNVFPPPILPAALSQSSPFGAGFKLKPPSISPAATESKSVTNVGVSSTEIKPHPYPPPSSCEAGPDFASLFKSETPKPFQFNLAISSKKEEEEEERVEPHEPDIHFEPIVTLPDTVEISSGEENEEAIFTERAKLFRFNSDLKQWKERGIGEMKILKNRETGKARVLMRRDQVLKICCNHLVTKEMTLAPMQNSNKAWTWFTPCDFAEEKGKPENLAIRFKSPAIATSFKEAFEKAAQSSADLCDKDDEGAQSRRRLPPQQTFSSSLPMNLTSRPPPPPPPPPPPQTAADEEDHSDRSPSSSRSPSPAPVSFKLTLLREDEDEDEGDVEIIGVELPSEEKVKEAERLQLPPSFYNYESQPPCPGCRGCDDLLTGPYPPVTESEKKGEDEEEEEERDEEVAAKDEKEKEDEKSEPTLFGGSEGTGGISFSSLAATTSGSETDGGFWGQTKTGFSSFAGAGTQLFASKPLNEDGNENPEVEVDLNFKPIVSLEAVEVKTGEEGETCLFSHRAKLYRFTSGTWKERGVGDIKILRNASTGRSRVVMRRDQIFKICCNHLLTPDIALERNASSEKAWTWKTPSDFADETPREETFTVKFKHKETADEFGKIFLLCLDERSRSPVGLDDVTPEGSPREEEKKRFSPRSPPLSPPPPPITPPLSPRCTERESDQEEKEEKEEEEEEEEKEEEGSIQLPLIEVPPSSSSPPSTPPNQTTTNS